jgi:site-specific DNA-methyltransferase (adenine-specific)
MRDVFAECLRVLKPGGYLLAFSAARTYHHMAMAAQTAGYEVRDQLMWIYGSGFPKSQDIGRSIQRSLGVKEKKTIKGGARPSDKMVTAYATENEYNQPVLTDPEAQEWSGWGTCLKPAHEPIVLARKPTKLTYAKNVQHWGTGALNIDATRIPMSQEDIDNDRIWKERYSAGNTGSPTFAEDDIHSQRKTQGGQTLDPVTGRFPSNVIGEFPDDIQKYFYCPKVSRKERHTGFDDAQIPQIGSTHPDDVKKHPLWDPSIGGDAARLKQKIIDAGQYKGNNHPTVKPVALMEYLIKLITPPGGTVLDPFNGSGSTGMAAVALGYEYIGIELDPNYVKIAETRISAWQTRDQADNTFDLLFEEDYET